MTASNKHSVRQNKNETLKTLLISIYGLTQTDKEASLLSIDGLGDRKPSALLRYMDSLTSPEHRKTTIYKALFLSQMPKVVCVALAWDPPTDIVDLAAAADDIIAADEATTEHNTIGAVETPYHHATQRIKVARLSPRTRHLAATTMHGLVTRHVSAYIIFSQH